MPRSRSASTPRRSKRCATNWSRSRLNDRLARAARPRSRMLKSAAVNTPSRLRTLGWSLAAAAVCAVLLVATSPGLPLVWDEGDTIARADQLGRLAALPKPHATLPGRTRSCARGIRRSRACWSLGAGGSRPAGSTRSPRPGSARCCCSPWPPARCATDCSATTTRRP